MRHTARWIALAVALFVVAFGVVLATQVGSDPQADATKSQLVGHPAPAFAVRTLAGKPLSLRELAGQTVVVNFWNSWCIPCQEELPALKDFYSTHAGDASFAMVGIVRDDTADAVQAYVKAEGIGWTIALDPDAAAALAFGTRGQPETYVISAQGTIAAAQIGPTSVKSLETMLSAARRPAT
jgi:cytochrome c biogenesis protein CcmG/thiol:disulfide interchange protein DsbE